MSGAARRTAVPTVVAVAVPVPYLGELSYRLPDGMPVPAIGARVRVPIGPRQVSGCVVAVESGRDLPDAGDSDGAEEATPARPGERQRQPASLKPITQLIDTEPYVPPEVIALCRWTADYYLAGIGDAVGLALPPGARGEGSGFRTQRLAALTAQGHSVLAALGAGAASSEATDAPDLPGGKLTAKQRAALDALAGAPDGLPTTSLRDRGITTDVLTRLATRGLVALRDGRHERDPFERDAGMAVAVDPTRALTPDQQQAFEQIAPLADAARFGVALLHGVTGSGKTEVYLRLAYRVVASGRRVLLMVPEIALTPSVAAFFRSAFGDRVAIQHSALGDGERHDQWHRIRRGEVDVVIGTRSAVFAPIERLGLIIVDEEHDGSYKQDEVPRYHGRDIAVVRGSREGALVVLGSATPSMESYQNATSGKYTLVTLDRRVLDRPMAAVRLVNMRDEYADGGPDVVISRPLAAALADRLERGEQSLVLLNRRGYATAVFCRQCGDTFECPNCSVSLTVHTTRVGDSRESHESRAARAAAPAVVSGWGRCHYCNYSLRIPKVCRKCAAPYLEQAGFGTEKVEAELQAMFPGARIGRVDRDSIRRKGALTSILSRFGAGEIDILVGTQMIAKGHDFARVTLVGVISADVGLGLADFRASERTFQLLTQVAGRAGRGERLGEAIVQTLHPEHYSVRLAGEQAYGAFFEKELVYRKLMHYPPAVALVNVIIRGRTFEEAMETAGDLVQRLGPATATGRFQILGPAPAPLGRLRGEHRVQFFLKGTRRPDMRQALRTVLEGMPEVRRRVTVDVDPLNVL